MEKTEIRKQAIRRALVSWINKKKTGAGNEAVKVFGTDTDTTMAEQDDREEHVRSCNENMVADNCRLNTLSTEPDQPTPTGHYRIRSATLTTPITISSLLIHDTTSLQVKRFKKTAIRQRPHPA